MKHYMSRIADGLLARSLASSGAVLIEGPKWCGKTSTARQMAKSVLMMQDPDKVKAYLQTAGIRPSLLLKGETPRLLDEWQIAPVLWDAVRFAVDERGQPGQFILTGSAVPTDDGIRHTGTGRISRMMMRTMSLRESRDSSGTVALADLFLGRNQEMESVSELPVEGIARAIVRGGWPASIGSSESGGMQQARDYVEAVIQQDLFRVTGTGRSPDKVRALMRSLARNTGTAASMETIRKDMASSDESVSIPSLSSYLDALKRIFVVEDLPAWNPALRSKTPLRVSPKRFFVDPSIAAAVLRVSAEGLLKDFATFGFLFESLCIRDLRVYAQAMDGDVFHYQDKTGLEADAVVSLRDGRWGAIEIKLGSTEFDEAAAHLIRLKERVDEERMNAPSFLMILTGTEFAYRRPDGVLVVPIGCLG